MNFMALRMAFFTFFLLRTSPAASTHATRCSPVYRLFKNPRGGRKTGGSSPAPSRAHAPALAGGAWGYPSGTSMPAKNRSIPAVGKVGACVTSPKAHLRKWTDTSPSHRPSAMATARGVATCQLTGLSRLTFMALSQCDSNACTSSTPPHDGPRVTRMRTWPARNCSSISSPAIRGSNSNWQPAIGGPPAIAAAATISCSRKRWPCLRRWVSPLARISANMSCVLAALKTHRHWRTMARPNTAPLSTLSGCAPLTLPLTRLAKALHQAPWPSNSVLQRPSCRPTKTANANGPSLTTCSSRGGRPRPRPRWAPWPRARWAPWPNGPLPRMGELDADEATRNPSNDMPARPLRRRDKNVLSQKKPTNSCNNALACIDPCP